MKKPAKAKATRPVDSITVAGAEMTADVPALSPPAQERIELMMLARALNFIDAVAAEPQYLLRRRRLLLSLVNALTRRGGPLIWQWGSWGQLNPYPAGGPFTEEYCDWDEGRQMFEYHGDPDIHWRLLCKGRPVTGWRPRTWADAPAQPNGADR